MNIAASPVARAPLGCLAALAFIAGAGGMALSFLFLASNHPLDVTAGAAGFVAGSILVASGLISLSIQRRNAVLEHSLSAPFTHAVAVPEPPIDVARWLAHFRANHENRPEPDWVAPITLPAEVIAPLLRSLEQFQLGDGGG